MTNRAGSPEPSRTDDERVTTGDVHVGSNAIATLSLSDADGRPSLMTRETTGPMCPRCDGDNTTHLIRGRMSGDARRDARTRHGAGAGIAIVISLCVAIFVLWACDAARRDRRRSDALVEIAFALPPLHAVMRGMATRAAAQSAAGGTRTSLRSRRRPHATHELRLAHTLTWPRWRCRCCRCRSFRCSSPRSRLRARRDSRSRRCSTHSPRAATRWRRSWC